MSDSPQTVVVTSFWNRPKLLQGLHFSTRLSVRTSWRMLVVDNGSLGENKEWLYAWSSQMNNIEIISRDPFSSPEGKRMSSAEHGAALNLAMDHLKDSADMIVIADSDIVWMKPRWNEFFLEKLKNFDHITTYRRNCSECPAPYVSAFYMNFIRENNIDFSPRVNNHMEVIRPCIKNDVGWMMNDLPKDRWGVLSQAVPGIGYSRSLSIKYEQEQIAEHLAAGRKKKEGRISKWLSICIATLEKNKKDLMHQEAIEAKRNKKLRKSK